MKIDKCKNCKHYLSSFNGCDLRYIAIYIGEGVHLGEGVLKIRPISVKSVSGLECKYEVISE